MADKKMARKNRLRQVIMVLVAAFLLVMATYIYLEQSQRRSFRCKAKTSEAKEMLKEIYISQMAYFDAHSYYSRSLLQLDIDYNDPTASAQHIDGRYYTFDMQLDNSGNKSQPAYSVKAIGKKPKFGIWAIDSKSGGHFKALGPYCQ